MTSNRKKKRQIGIAALALSLALAGAACGGSDTGSSGYSPQSDPAPEPVTEEVESGGFELALYVQRDNVQIGLSTECYQFYSDGTVELRHGSNDFETVNDFGVVYGDENAGQIDWNSGRSTSYEWEGGSDYRVDGASGAVIESCV